MRRRFSSRIGSLDAFRSVPEELSVSSEAGGMMTIISVVVGAALLLCELRAYFTVEDRSELFLDDTDTDTLQINFDVEFYDVECQYLKIGTRDAFGTERMGLEASVTKQVVNRDGEATTARPYTQEELFLLDHDAEVSAEEAAEADADWISSSDDVKHHSLEPVVQGHDYTFILFYARATKNVPKVKCAPCKAIRPVWDSFEEDVNTEYQRGAVRALRVNCVDFQGICADNGITTLPALRLYQRGPDALMSYWEHPTVITEVTVAKLTAFLQRKMEGRGGERKTAKQAEKHFYFSSGCRARGRVVVPRVPGTLRFEPSHGPEVALNFAVTNVSHKVHHLSFGPYGERLAKEWQSRLPRDFQRSVALLDGEAFVTDKFHRAPHHYFKVVATTYTNTLAGSFAQWFTSVPLATRSFQMTHQSRISSVPVHSVPSARFSYDLSPVEVRVRRARGRAWYDFITTVFAVVGGVFSVAAILSGLMRTISTF